MPQNIHENLEIIRAQLENFPEAHLIAVTKYVDTDMTRAVLKEGIRHLGENRPDNFLAKKATVMDEFFDIKWHFIGHLQTRQVKKVIDEIDFLHSLDRPSLADEIQKRASNKVACFMQVNVSGEESKGGFEPDQVLDQVRAWAEYDKLEIVGLMTMAPIDASEDQLHQYFNNLRAIQISVQALGQSNAPCGDLSMGMSNDYQIALEEGATYIRLGSAIFSDGEEDRELN